MPIFSHKPNRLSKWIRHIISSDLCLSKVSMSCSFPTLVIKPLGNIQKNYILLLIEFLHVCKYADTYVIIFQWNNLVDCVENYFQTGKNVPTCFELSLSISCNSFFLAFDQTHEIMNTIMSASDGLCYIMFLDIPCQLVQMLL